MQAQQIVTLANQTAKTPGYTSQAGQFLNQILNDLAEAYDFEVNLTTAQITLTTGPAPTSGIAISGAATNTGSGPYALPTNYLRMASNEMFYYVYGVPYVMVNVDLSEFDALVQQAGISNYPLNFATDRSTSPASLMVWPPPGGSYIANIRYYKDPDDITTPETSTTVPWFPNQSYLINKLSAAMMGLSGDKRQADFNQMADATLKSYLLMQSDDDGRAKTVQLDRRRFGRSFDRLPNTKTLGW